MQENEHIITENLNLSVNKNLLLKALSHIQSIVERRNIIPILSNVKLSTENDILILTATDMDITVSENIQVETKQNGSITISAHIFYDIVKKFPDDSIVQLIVDNVTKGQLNVVSGFCKFSIPFLSSVEFPIINIGEINSKFAIYPSELIHMIDKSKFAISQEETRYNLNGIYFHKEINDGKYLKAAATDGHRLSKVAISLPDDAFDMPNVIIPRKTIMEVRKLLETTKEKIEISLSQNKIIFNFGQIELVSKLIEASFPEYENLIPYSNNKILSVNTKIFSKAIDRVSIISFDKLKSVKLEIEKDKLTIISSSELQGSASEELSVDYNSDESITIGFNSRYLLDILGVIEGDFVEFYLNDNYSPVLVKDNTDKSSTYVIMPMII